uniref:Reelin domain-containing protein n=1 Tax=Astyanax mexicanus TaxID=7994 RepID=A0A8B9KR77_ASTMX
MIVLKAVLVGCVWVSVWPARCVCFSRGAGSSSCVDMKPGHISAQPPYTHSSVAIHTSSSIYLPQHTLMVSVRSSRAFMGLLLQARSVPEDRVVGGQFTLYPLGTHTLSCVSTADTVTHSNKRLKRNLSFSWRAPAQPSGDLRFYITVVHSYFVYWERIPSDLVYDGTRRNRSPVYDANRLTRMISGNNAFPHVTEELLLGSGGPSESSPPQRPREQPRAPDEKGVKPDLVPSHKASELDLLLLLGLSAGLGMAVAVGLRYLQRKHCRKRTAMSLGDQSHGNSGVIRVQECGDLVQVRRIRENSFLLLQAEYNLITTPGS